MLYPKQLGARYEGRGMVPKGQRLKTARTNVSLEHYLFELMKDEKYQTIHMSHVGSILQITLIRINVFKVYLHINSNKKIVDNLVK